MAKTKDKALIDNVDELDPNTGLTVHFERGKLLSSMDDWAKDRLKGSAHLWQDVKVEMKPAVSPDDGSDDDDDDEPAEPNRRVHTQGADKA